MIRGIRNAANVWRDAKSLGTAVGTAYMAGQALYERYKKKPSYPNTSVAEGRKLVAAVKRQQRMIDRGAMRMGIGRKRKYKTGRIGKGKRNKRLKRTIQNELEKGKSIGKYKKVVVEHRYRNFGGNVTNSQGVHEFYHFRPKELLDAVSVLFNGKAYGSRELSRYWNGTKKKRTIVVKPGATVLVDTHTLPKTGVNWEDMKYQGSVINFKKGITSGTILVQQNPLLYTYTTDTGHRIGVPPAYQCGFAVKTNFMYRALCPDQAALDKNVDNFVYLNNMSTSQAVANSKMPSKPMVDNIETALIEQ